MAPARFLSHVLIRNFAIVYYMHTHYVHTDVAVGSWASKETLDEKKAERATKNSLTIRALALQHNIILVLINAHSHPNFKKIK